MACAGFGVMRSFVPLLSSSGVTDQTPRQGLRGAQALATGEGWRQATNTEPASAFKEAVSFALGVSAIAAVGLAARRRASKFAPAASRGQRLSRCAMDAVGKKVLVMGGTRFIGCYLVKKLRDMGCEVFVLNRGKTNGGMPEPLPGMSDAEYAKMLEGVTVLVADRKKPDTVKSAISSAGKFDIVFDNNARKLEDVEPLVEAIEATGGCDQFVFMSSAGVYGPTDIMPLTEANPGDPNSRHKEKLSCEKYLDSKGFNWTSIRPVYIYGPLNYNPVERFFFDRVARGRPICIPYGGMYMTQLGHCEDLANFMCKCIGNPKVSKQVYNISGEEFVTFDGMAKACAKAAGKDAPKIVHYDAKSVKVPEGFPKAFPFRGMHFFASIDKAKSDIPDWAPNYSLLGGLKSSYEQDYVGRGFDKKDVDYSTDDLILKSVGETA